LIEEVRGTTRIYGLIGNPIGHTLSPVMFNAAFSEYGLDCIYVPFRVEKKFLGKAIDGMRALDIAGLNVTIPYKVEVMKMLDEVDEEAQRIGAVNTIVNSSGVLKGFNTDGQGFLYALHRQSIDIAGKNILVLGAGGASRAIVSALAVHNANITILNRTFDKAKELARTVHRKPGTSIKAMELNLDNLGKCIVAADVLINSTNLGMTPETDVSAVPPSLLKLKPELTVVDIVYNPLETKLITDAENAGCKVVEGIHMLVGQGALSFEKWMGRKAPVELMTTTALINLQKR
jgi:shikimate dehydrogenase